MLNGEVVHLKLATVPYNSPAALLGREVARITSSWPIKQQTVAIKVHFGEEGSTRFIRSVYVGKIVEALKNKAAYPFCTDTGVLYQGARALAPSHLEVAHRHGFNYATINCPIIIADGLCGQDSHEVEYEGKYFSKVPVASAIFCVDYLVVVTHVTLHGFSGLGSTVKNLGMGCLAMKGKALVHQATCPTIKTDICVGCGACIERCRFGALSLRPQAVIDVTKCTGCCHCIGVCPQDAFELTDRQYLEFCERLVDASLAVIRNKKIVYVNFLVDITRQCDCASFTHPPVCNDIGILISEDLYAVESATFDLVNQAIEFASEDPRPKRILELIAQKTGRKDLTYSLRSVDS